jgi:hypothetical protein
MELCLPDIFNKGEIGVTILMIDLHQKILKAKSEEFESKKLYYIHNNDIWTFLLLWLFGNLISQVYTGM